MKIEFRNSFLKDLKKIKDKKIKQDIEKILIELKEIPFTNLKNLKKLSGYKDFYRIKLGDYRIGIKITDKKIIFVRILSRKDTYKYFP